jgi:superfamily II DNA or RNA helicase
MTRSSPDAVRAAIARAWLGRPEEDRRAETGGSDECDATAIDEATVRTPTPIQLGAITLHAHQRAAADRLRQIIRAEGGALLADATGLGKTYVALAVAQAIARRTAIIAPAALRAMWLDALARSGVTASVRSTESLSRGRGTPVLTHDAEAARGGGAGGADLVIVDEAHHFRNPRTRRYAALARESMATPLLLLTATPIHNGVDELRTLLALFLGMRARRLDESQLARYTVRRVSATGAGSGPPAGASTRVPVVEPLRWITVADDVETLHAIERLPAPVPPRDGGAADALVAHALIRQWASSADALRAALRRRLARGGALIAALEDGRYPSYRDLREWCVGDGAVQLAFSELLVPPTPDADRLLPALRAHDAAVRALLRRLDAVPDPDLARAAALRTIVARHRHQPIVAFAAYQETVHAIERRIGRDLRICALGARGARVAGGALGRRLAIARFAPIANHAPRPSDAQRIDLLITTDLLSEGVNLQDAVAVVHLDLPWTPARMEQRVGRVARLGSRHASIATYALAPPASAEDLIGVERRLHEKIHEAGRLIGLVGSILPVRLSATIGSSGDELNHSATIRSTLERWLARGFTQDERSEAFGDRLLSSVAGADAAPIGIPIAAIEAACAVDPPTYLALCRVERTAYLVAALDGGPPTDDATVVARCVRLADDGADRLRTPDRAPADGEDADAIVAALDAWIARRRAAHDAGIETTRPPPGDVCVRAIGRIADAVRRAPVDRRPRVAALARAARRAVEGHGAGGEAEVAEIMGTNLPDEDWLTALATRPAPPDRLSADVRRRAGAIVAILILRGTRPPSSSDGRRCTPADP